MTPHPKVYPIAHYCWYSTISCDAFRGKEYNIIDRNDCGFVHDTGHVRLEVDQARRRNSTLLAG